jgi:copper transport protein
VAAICVVVLIATGVYAAWRDLGGWGALTGTEQGVLLLVKLVVMAMLLVAAAFSRRWVRARTAAKSPDRWREVRGMRWSVGAESALAAGVLAVTAALVAVPPGRNDWRPASSFDLTAGPVRVQLSVVPLGPNRLDLHAYTFSETGAPRDVPELTATADEPALNIAGLPVRFLNAGPGHFLANGVTLPASGEWTVDLRVRTSGIDEYTTTARFTVR